MRTQMLYWMFAAIVLSVMLLVLFNYYPGK